MQSRAWESCFEELKSVRARKSAYRFSAERNDVFDVAALAISLSLYGHDLITRHLIRT
jgi:hypothetical protein